MKKLLMLLKLFLFFLLFYLSITAGNFWESNSQAVYQTAKNLVDKGSFVIDCKWEAAEYQGKCYSKYGLFISLIVVPFYSAGKIFSEVFYFIPLPPQFFQQQEFIFKLLIFMLIISFLFFAVYQSPTGDLIWGTRYLYISLPVFIFSLMYFIKYNHRRILTKIFILIIGISIIVQISSIYINFHRYYAYLSQKLGYRNSFMIFIYFFGMEIN